MPDGKPVWRMEKLLSEAKLGNPTAQVGLGMIYQNGFGVEPNEELACHWYSKAAEQGDDDAQALLGLMYEIGTGVEKDLEKAKRWYGLSAEQGNAEALSLLDRLVSVAINSGV